MLILSIHPVSQLTAILLAYYAGYLGLQRLRGLHFGQPAKFPRKLHILAGSISLTMLLTGFAAGHVIVARFMENPDIHLHEFVANLLLPFILFGLLSGFYMTFIPEKRKILPAIHALNNLLIALLLPVQIYTGLLVYRTHVLTG